MRYRFGMKGPSADGLVRCRCRVPHARRSEPGAVASACPGSPAKATVWRLRSLWRDTTVFYPQYEGFALLGAPIDGAAIIAGHTCISGSRFEAACSFAATGAAVPTG